MPIPDLDGYIEAVETPTLRVPFFKVPLTTVIGRFYDTWTTAALPGSTPTTAAAPTKATTGAIGRDLLANVTADLRLVGANLSSNQAGTFYLVDRLSHQGGLSGVVTTAQTTNLPTAALTRYTDGEGVLLGLTIYTQIGTTATTVTASYTNQAGTSGRTTKAVVIGGTAFREAGRLILLPLQDGDTGVRAVASVTVLATTGTAGAFGVTLFKPLAGFVGERPGGQQRFNVFDGMGGFVRDVDPSACLGWVYCSAGTSTSLAGTLTLVENT